MNILKYKSALLLFFLIMIISLPVQADDGLRIANLNIHTDPLVDIYPNYIGINPIYYQKNSCPVSTYPDLSYYIQVDESGFYTFTADEKTGKFTLLEDAFKEMCKTPASCMTLALKSCENEGNNSNSAFLSCIGDVLDSSLTNSFQSICRITGSASLSDCNSELWDDDPLNLILAFCEDSCTSASSRCSTCLVNKISEEKEKAVEKVCASLCRDSADPDCMNSCVKKADMKGITVMKQPEDPGVQDFPEPSEEILRDIQELSKNNMLGTKSYEATYYHFPAITTSENTDMWEWDFFGSENNFIVHFVMEWDPDDPDSEASSCGVFGRWADYRNLVTMSMDRTGWAEIGSTVKGSSYVNNTGSFVRMSDQTPSSFTVAMVEQNASIVFNGNLATYSKNITLNSGSWGLMHLRGQDSACLYHDIEILVLE